MNGKIHFLNTGHSDCIIIESQGKIAMVDAAEDTDYPADKPNLNLPGYEDVVVDYLLKNFSDENGKVNIDFVLGTHAHSDHIGGFDTVILHPDISVNRAYLKPYNEEDIFIMEVQRWDNKEVYNQMFDAIKKRDVTLIDSFDNAETELGDFKLNFYNGSYIKRKTKFGENINSVVTLLTLGNTRFVLAGDLNNKNGDEKKFAEQLGKVNLLKVGHHGYAGSTSFKWAKTLCPEYAVVCNKRSAVYPQVAFKLSKIAKAEILSTVDNNGIIAETDGNTIKIIKDIM